MTTATQIPNVPLPADGTAVGQWNLDDGSHFQGRIKRSVLTTYGALVTVETAGDQWHDGRVDRYIRPLHSRWSHDFFSFFEWPLGVAALATVSMVPLGSATDTSSPLLNCQ